MIDTKVFLSKINLDENLRREMIKEFISLHNNYVYPTHGNNLPVSNNYIKYLKNFFIKKCVDIYGDIRIFKDPRNEDGWVFLNNKDWYKGVNIHDHHSSCDIVGVYYLNVPGPNTPINFHDVYGNYISTFQPQTNDLIIFPSNLIHSIPHCNYDDYRIAVNFEIAVERKVSIVEI